MTMHTATNPALSVLSIQDFGAMSYRDTVGCLSYFEPDLASVGDLTVQHRLTPAGDIVPHVGMAATLCLLSDRYAYTVVSVSASGKTCQVRQDVATRTDDNGMSDVQRYSYTPNPSAPLVTVRLTKRGWRSAQGRFAMGVRRAYYDFSF